MPVTRSKSLIELATQSKAAGTNAAVKTELGITDPEAPSALVHTTGNETVAGVKTFSSGIATPVAIVSTLATGTAPLTVASTTKVANLNAALLDGAVKTDFALASALTTLSNDIADLDLSLTVAIAANAADIAALETHFDSSAVSGDTRFLLYDVDSAALVRVTVGADDSGGTGYKVLRIPN
jgi:hypothetical protein